MQNLKKILTAIVVGITAMTATAQTWEIGRPNAENVIATLDANGTYLVIAEVKDRSGKVYRYSARLGVKR